MRVSRLFSQNAYTRRQTRSAQLYTSFKRGRCLPWRRRAADREFESGYQTASTAFGVKFFSSLEGCRIEAIDPPRVNPD